RSLRPPSKNTRSPRVKSSSALPNRERIRRADRAIPRSLPKSREKNVTIRSLSPSGKLPITTAGVLPRAMSRGQAQAELPQRPVVLPPPRPDAHGQRQVDLDPEEGLQLAPRGRADPLEHAAGLADQDALLRVALHEDRGLDVQRLGRRPLPQLFYLDRGRVRD